MTWKDLDFQLAKYAASADSVVYFAAERTTILLGSDSDEQFRQLCQLTFTRDGGLLAQFTYYRKDRGVVGLVTTTLGSSGESRIDFSEQGKTSTHIVKYNHPPDGRAHFSQDGRHVTQFWSDAIDLRTDQGHLFELHAFDLTHFSILERLRSRRLYLPFYTRALPDAVTVAVEWRTKGSLSALARERGTIIGPIAEIPRRHDGRLFRAALVGQPQGFPLQDHVLTINVGPREGIPSTSDPALIVFGGWQRSTGTIQGGDTVTLLAFHYPVGDFDQSSKRIGSSDYVADTAAD
jgi:hypothetical protein